MKGTNKDSKVTGPIKDRQPSTKPTVKPEGSKSKSDPLGWKGNTDRDPLGWTSDK